jgi:K+-sensing histidine kinase KdpD
VFGYLLAVAVTLLAVAVRWLLHPWLGEHLTLVTLFGAVGLTVWMAGYGPAIAAALLGYVLCDYLFIGPLATLELDDFPTVIGLLAYLLSSGIIILFGEAMRTARQRVAHREELLRVTLASIGDAVITTDLDSRVTSVNADSGQWGARLGLRACVPRRHREASGRTGPRGQ